MPITTSVTQPRKAEIIIGKARGKHLPRTLCEKLCTAFEFGVALPSLTQNRDSTIEPQEKRAALTPIKNATAQILQKARLSQSKNM
jgi:hypothetical protein